MHAYNLLIVLFLAFVLDDLLVLFEGTYVMEKEKKNENLDQSREFACDIGLTMGDEHCVVTYLSARP